jgi:hypothetical protein
MAHFVILPQAPIQESKGRRDIVPLLRERRPDVMAALVDAALTPNV